MPDLKTKAVSLLGSTSAVDMYGTTKTILYTVPVGKTAYVTEVIVRDPSASLAGGTSYAFGTGASADTWMTAVSLALVVTASTGFTIIRPTSGALLVESAASSEFGIKATTGSTANPCTATIDVFGYLV